jgi:hypothetical protein
MRVISSARCHLLVLVPVPPGVDGVPCIAVGAEASPNGCILGTLPLAWGLVDGHILDTLPDPIVRAARRSFPTTGVFDMPFGDSHHETLS